MGKFQFIGLLYHIAAAYLDISCWNFCIRPSYLPSAMSWTYHPSSRQDYHTRSTRLKKRLNINQFLDLLDVGRWTLGIIGTYILANI